MQRTPTKLTDCMLLAVCCLAATFSSSYLALETDKQQPVDWSSDGDSRMSIEGETRILEMSENVKVTQGSLEIFGDHAVFEHNAQTNILNRVTVNGSPVRYQQLLDEDGESVVGTSDTILLYRNEIDDEMIVELIGNASIESPDSSWRCAAITYIVDRNLIPETKGPCDGSVSPSSN